MAKNWSIKVPSKSKRIARIFILASVVCMHCRLALDSYDFLWYKIAIK